MGLGLSPKLFVWVGPELINIYDHAANWEAWGGNRFSSVLILVSPPLRPS